MLSTNQFLVTCQLFHLNLTRGHHGCDQMVAGFTTTCRDAISAYTTKDVSSNPFHGEVYSIQHYVINFVS
jgi:hypothetical protein